MVGYRPVIHGEGLTPPRFCPGCGAEFRDTKESRALMPIGQPFGPSLDRAELEPEITWGWDCYCVACEWSGDIRPDE